jgi:predicted enzyme related to lactoylglutathione lyase
VELTSHPAGTFCFPELNTRDMDGSKRFYGRLLNWTWLDVPSAAGGYSLLRVEGKDVAGLHRSDRGEPSWVCYLAVDSADRVAARATDQGAELLAPPFDVPGVGRMALIGDPARAPFGLWEARGMIGVALEDQPGAPCWYELLTLDVPAAIGFYGELFGWRAAERTLEGVGPYTVARIGDRPVAGLMTIREDWGPVTPRWQPYFAVDDCAHVAQEAQAFSGRVLAGPVDVPEVGRFAVLADPCEAAFGIFQDVSRPRARSGPPTRTRRPNRPGAPPRFAMPSSSPSPASPCPRSPLRPRGAAPGRSSSPGCGPTPSRGRRTRPARRPRRDAS